MSCCCRPWVKMGEGGLPMPRLLLDACNELPAPTPPSLFDRGLLVAIEVRSAACSVVSAWLLSLHLETVPVSRSCWGGGIPHGNAGDLVSGTLARSGQAVPLLRMLSSSPGLYPSADGGVWVTARDANNSHYSLLVLTWFLKAGIAGGAAPWLWMCGCLDEDECPVKGVAEQQMGSRDK